MSSPEYAPRRRTLQESLQEYGRGIAGGLLFSLPLLYTMEVWWRGFLASPARLLPYVLLTFVLLLGYNRYSGMRRSARFYEVIIDSVEEMGLGLVISVLILFLLGRISFETPFPELLGKVVIESMTVAIGVSVGTAQLGGGGGEDTGVNGMQDSGEADAQAEPLGLPGELVIGFCGAVLFAGNIAPTEEVLLIGLETSPARILGLVVLSLLICAIVLFFSGFVRSERLVRRHTWRWVGFGIISSYAVALLASALMLWFFGRFQGVPVSAAVQQTVVLAFPAALGSSAGRLLIQ